MHTELGSWQRAWRRVGKAEVEVEVDADMVEEKLEEEAEEEEKAEDEEGGRGRGGQLAEETTLIKSNNPHLAGGEKTQLQPPVGPSVDSLCHPRLTTTNLPYRFPIFETSATALCGTTGIHMISQVYISYIDLYIICSMSK